MSPSLSYEESSCEESLQPPKHKNKKIWVQKHRQNGFLLYSLKTLLKLKKIKIKILTVIKSD
jgi:hypothetical protein